MFCLFYHNEKLDFSLSCDSPELGPAPTTHKYTDDVPASAGCCAAGDLSANTGDQCSGYRWSDGGSPGDLSRHHCRSVQLICSSSPDCRTLHQSCHCKNAAPRIYACSSCDLISSAIDARCDFPLRSVQLPWELSPSFSVPSPPLPSSPVPCPTWLASPARSSQTPRDRWVPQTATQFMCVMCTCGLKHNRCTSAGNLPETQDLKVQCVSLKQFQYFIFPLLQLIDLIPSELLMGHSYFPEAKCCHHRLSVYLVS